MRILLFTGCIILLSWLTSSCGGSKGQTFCDTACITDSFYFSHPHPDTPYVKMSMRNCQPDTIYWSHNRLLTVRKQTFDQLVGKKVRLNKEYLDIYFRDTSYAWLRFNDCMTGRGYLVKLPYSKSDKWSIYTSALNDFDPKYHVEDGMIAYYDETFIYAQELATGKMDRMLMNNTKLDIDHDNPHGTFDSIHISRNRIWANIMINSKWVAKEKKIDPK